MKISKCDREFPVAVRINFQQKYLKFKHNSLENVSFLYRNITKNWGGA